MGHIPSGLCLLQLPALHGLGRTSAFDEPIELLLIPFSASQLV